MKKLTQLLLLQSLCLTAFSAYGVENTKDFQRFCQVRKEKPAVPPTAPTAVTPPERTPVAPPAEPELTEEMRDKLDFVRFAKFCTSDEEPKTNSVWNEKKKSYDLVPIPHYITDLQSKRSGTKPLGSSGSGTFYGTNHIVLDNIGCDGKVIASKKTDILSNYQISDRHMNYTDPDYRSFDFCESTRSIWENQLSDYRSGIQFQEVSFRGGSPFRNPLKRPSMTLELKQIDSLFLTMTIQHGAWKFVDFPKTPQESGLRINWEGEKDTNVIFVDKKTKKWKKVAKKYATPAFSLPTGKDTEGNNTTLNFPDKIEEAFHSTLGHDTKTGIKKETKPCDATVFTLLNTGINGKIVIDPTMTKKIPTADNFWEKEARKMAKTVQSSQVRHEMDGKIYEEFKVDGQGAVFERGKASRSELRPTMKFRIHPDDLVHLDLAPISGTWTIVDATPHGSKSNVSINWAGTGDSKIEYVRKKYTAGEKALERLMTWKQPD